ncbi:hypothetical protein P280DRAFT_476427 [Massarina eburnea CBS 473.64]|uniref:Probable double zinc ribbon domain-containing protein n=1 Tax=Massarina eburnea CBS 473.64 TaxID=1395130 RepID=A0A6A6SDQ9_9PLEO|nr:hypothetical protein P280DRAFT_476427 [Massarina eburnea CBS 473.64]
MSWFSSVSPFADKFASDANAPPSLSPEDRSNAVYRQPTRVNRAVNHKGQGLASYAAEGAWARLQVVTVHEGTFEVPEYHGKAPYIGVCSRCGLTHKAHSISRFHKHAIKFTNNECASCGEKADRTWIIYQIRELQDIRIYRPIIHLGDSRTPTSKRGDPQEYKQCDDEAPSQQRPTTVGTTPVEAMRNKPSDFGVMC